MTQLLLSVRDADEARTALAAGAVLIDCKEPLAGALGRPEPLAVEAILERVVAVGNSRDRRPQDAFAVVLQRRRAELDALETVLRHDLPQARVANAVGRNLRRNVPLALFRRPHVGQDHRHHIRNDFAPARELHRRNDQPLLKDLARQWHRSWRHATDVGVMRTIGVSKRSTSDTLSWL